MNPLHFVTILDKSESMDHLTDAVINGFNEFIAQQKIDTPNAKLSSVQFNHRVSEYFYGEPFEHVRPLDHRTYAPAGNTALWDAIGQAVTDVADYVKRFPARVLCAILTDGFENSSTEYNLESVKRLVERMRAAGWEFIFMGSNQDATKTGPKLGILPKYCVSCQASAASTTAAFKTVSHAAQSFATGSFDQLALQDSYTLALSKEQKNPRRNRRIVRR